MKEKICVTNSTVVSTTNVPCPEGYWNSDCILYENAIAYLSLPINSSMTDVVNALLLSLINVRNRVTVLEQKVEALTP